MASPAPGWRHSSFAATTRSRGLSLHNQAASKAAGTTDIEPRSAHTADPFLQAFLSPTFDAAEYLNSTLPPLQGSSSSSSSSATKAVPLAALAADAQAAATQLSAHTTRLAATLSQLTDDILRSGSRLAYEVELLRGEALGLSEALLGGGGGGGGPLRADLDRFVPPAVERAAAAAVAEAPPATPATAGTAAAAAAGAGTGAGDAGASAAVGVDEPPYITQLRTLTLVRARLDAVIKTFGEAMEFVFPPSEISVSSGFLSVSAPDFPDRSSSGSGSAAAQVSMEERGQRTLKELREEVAGLLRGRAGAGREEKVRGVEEATLRVEEIKTLSLVWRGTAEEKGRMRFVETLVKMVEDRHRELVKEAEGQRDRQQGRRGQDESAGLRREQAGSSEAAAAETRGPLGGYGFMNQWQKIRGGL